MSLLTAIDIGAQGLSAQRKRLEVLVSNLVNAKTTAPPGSEPYRRKDVVFAETAPEAGFGTALDDVSGAVRGVEVAAVVTDDSPPIRRYEPGHPHADRDGYVTYPNINPMEEMVDMLSATRSYEANLQAVGTAKEMAQKTIDLLR